MAFFRRRSASALPEDWEALVARHVGHWRVLDDDERRRLGELLTELLVDKRWEAARGFELSDRIRVVVAAQAALLVLGLDLGWYRDIHTIVVHPTTMSGERTSEGPVPGTETCGTVDLLGEAAYQGPVVIAWDSASAAARHPDRGHDVTLHEFAHKLDMLDGVVDGTPPFDDPGLFERWVEVCTREFERLADEDDPDGLIDPYGATDAGEFFAVVTETFFTRPRELSAGHPDLYDVFRRFYRQDPAARLERAAAQGR